MASVNAISSYNSSNLYNTSFKNKKSKTIYYGNMPPANYKAKKWGVGISSALIPGLGQLANGDGGKAAGYFFAGLACCLMRQSEIGIILGTVGILTTKILSVIDAVQNAR